MYFDLLNAVSHLERPDGIIAIPGPDSYYLAAYPTHEQALARMIRVTHQQESFLLLGRDTEAISPYVEAIPPVGLELMKKHWPGSLEMLLPARDSVSEILTDGSGRVKLMQPDSPRLMALLSLVPPGVLAVCSASRLGACRWVRHKGSTIRLGKMWITCFRERGKFAKPPSQRWFR